MERFFIFESGKNGRCSENLKVTLILQYGRFFLMLFCNRVLNARDKLPRYDKAIENSFF